MIWQTIKKQFLIFGRNRQQLLLLFALPVLLIVILSVSLSSFMAGERVQLQTKVALIEEESEAEQIAQLVGEIQAINNLEETQKREIVEGVKQTLIIAPLEEVLEKTGEAIQLDKVHATDEAAILNDDTYTAIIKVPKQFTADTLRAAFLAEGNPGKLTITLNESSELSAQIVTDVVTSFQNQLTILIEAGKVGIDTQTLLTAGKGMKGEVVEQESVRPISAKQYYTIGMAVMNVLYIATAVGSFAFVEKELHVFDRIMLANISPRVYLFGIFISTMIFSLFQLFFVFGFSWIFFGVTWPDLVAFIMVTIGLASAVGGLAVFMTAVSYRTNSEFIINFISTVLVAFLALIGGSFFPIGELSSILQKLGNFTPNGAGMVAYISLLRGENIATILPYLLGLCLFTISMLIVAILFFPKRGSSS